MTKHNPELMINDERYSLIEVSFITKVYYALAYEGRACHVRKTNMNNIQTYVRVQEYTLPQIKKLAEKYNKLFNTDKFGYLEIHYGLTDTI